ncbi:MAG: hypothetical protein IJ214_01630 [Clostridia bacterium]|nr:hypothetical protein [Clostridia bacterium]
MNIQSLTLLDVQPSQFYISEKKLGGVEAWFDCGDLSNFEPIPIKMLNGLPVITDGHTRAVAALMHGVIHVPLVEESEELDWEMYRRCVAACREKNIFSPADLVGRVINENQYVILWDRWCDQMQNEVLNERKKKRIGGE